MAKDYQDQLKIDLETKADEVIDTLPDFSKKFFNNLKFTEKSSRTRLQYAYDMKRFFDFIGSSAGFKNININVCTAAEVLDKLELEDIQEFLNKDQYSYKEQPNGTIKKTPKSPAARARMISCLRSFYKFYARIGEIEKNTAELIDLPAIPDRNISTMDKDQVARILDAISNTANMKENELAMHKKIEKRDFAIMMLFFGTGIRVSELVGIDISDIDFYNGSIAITRKGGDEDIVYFGPEVNDALLDYINNSRSVLEANDQDKDALFISSKHNRISVRNVETMIKKYAKRAGLNIKVTPHTLRRTYGTTLYEETNDIY